MTLSFAVYEAEQLRSPGNVGRQDRCAIRVIKRIGISSLAENRYRSGDRESFPGGHKPVSERPNASARGYERAAYEAFGPSTRAELSGCVINDTEKSQVCLEPIRQNSEPVLCTKPTNTIWPFQRRKKAIYEKATYRSTQSHA